MNHLRLLRADGISHRHQADWRDIRLYWRITTSSFPPPARSYTTTRNKIFSTAQRLQLDFENFIFSFLSLLFLYSFLPLLLTFIRPTGALKFGRD